MPAGLRPDPANYPTWQAWAEAEARWSDQRFQEEFGQFRQVENLHTIGATGEPAFQNAWVGSASTGGLKFWKDAFGLVHFEGTINNPVIPSAYHVIFVLPTGYAPSYIQLQMNILIQLAGVTTPTALLFQTNGNVEYLGGSPGATSSIHLTGFHYRTDAPVPR